jgi:hypothetical protein
LINYLNFAMSCILHLSGVKFDVDAFVLKTRVRPYKVFHKGEVRSKTKSAGPTSARSGLAIEVSKADMDDLNGQITDAIRFLTRNRAKLRPIKTTKSIDYAILDFGINRKIDGDQHLMESHLLPSRLLHLAAEVGLSIQLSFYAANMQEVLEERSPQKKVASRE